MDRLEVEHFLDQEVSRFRGLTFAESTKKAYTVHLRTYLSFCSQMSYTPVPATEAVLQRYVAFLAQRLAYSSISQYLNIIRIIHVENGYKNPLQENFQIQCVLRGIRRAVGDCIVAKSPITPGLLLQLMSQLNLQKPLDSAIWAAALTGFFCMLRRSNLLPATASPPSGSKHLLRGDLEFSQDTVCIVLRHTKTIQFQERVLRIPLLRINSALCPYLAIRKHCVLTNCAPAASSAFVCSNNPPFPPLTISVFLDRVKEVLAKYGNDPTLYSGHSFRRGGASFAHQAGVPLHTIRQLGDWRSDAYIKYIFDDLSSFKTHCFPMYEACRIVSTWNK